MALKSKGKRAIQAAVDNHTPFKHETLSARWLDRMEYGHMVPALGASLAAEIAVEGRAFVIFSYRTPIAWMIRNEGWVVPDTRYSVTTTHHQNVTRTAVANPGFYANARW
jgi:hypothetical protein